MRITLAVVAGIAALLIPGTAMAAPPGNDDFANATAIDPSALPYSDVVNTTDSTAEEAEPQSCNYMTQTVWYVFKPTTTGLVRADNSGTGFATDLNVYQDTGGGLAGLSFIGCTNNFNPVHFTAQAGVTYYIQTGILYGATGDLKVNLQAVPPPVNDDFAHAKPLSAPPSSDSVDATAATVEASEPTPTCGYGQSAGTIWYTFTPSVSGSYMATSSAYYFSTQVAVYAGSSLSSLTQIACRSLGQALTFHADAGTTYYLQTGGLVGGRGTINVNFFVAPDPVAGFYFYPSDPSSFDTVQFFDQSYDPGGIGFTSSKWDFGDGGTSTNPGCCPSHRYLADGDYTVKLTVTTNDGRTASTTQVMHVRTHDVAVAKMTVPQSASSGQTRPIVVGLSNKRYAETVRIDLYRSTPTGFVQFASSTQSVPVRTGNKTTDFAFNYVFTGEDASLGKVTFKAIATIVNARDALPSDNEAISLPTKVVR